MPKLDITNDEQNLIITCVETELKSAARAQNNGKTPQIKEVYGAQVKVLEALKTKINAAK